MQFQAINSLFVCNKQIHYSVLCCNITVKTYILYVITLIMKELIDLSRRIAIRAININEKTVTLNGNVKLTSDFNIKTLQFE